MVDLTSGPTVESEGLPGRAFPRLEDSVSPQAYGSELGQGIEKASDVLQNVHDKVQAQARQTQLTAAHVQLQNLSLGLTHDPQTGALAQQGQNAFGLDGKYLPAFDAGAQSIGEGIADPKVKALFQSQVVPQTRQHLSEQLDTHELTQHQEYAAQTAQASIGMAAQTAAANYNHPDIVAANKDTVDFNINALAQQKGWSPEVTAYNLQKAHTEFHSQIVDSMIGQGQLHQAQTYLFQQTANGDVDPKAAEGMQRTITAQQEHQIAMADKQQRDASNAVLKNMILLNQSGKLTPQYIEKFHNTLEPQAYEFGYNLLAGKEATTDVHTYVPLLQDTLEGKDRSNDIREAMYSGKISLKDGASLLERTDQPRANYVKRGAQYINESLKPSSLLPDPLAQRGLANALSDWDQTVRDNPDMDDVKAKTLYTQITDHYTDIHATEVMRANAVPLHLVGTRDKPDILGTARETKAAFERGEISPETFRQQQQLILQWAAVAKKPETTK